ncbi:Golgi-associated plant pathogenesis-related protein 1 [Orchesella cincta]|uniref:Golgi-associated plant pathogenesis-related protein 1 n=1 Tax=Orchesella cincta TaxID=48709 RepID=A0A1D2M1W2_ORCCI|nr:Golgi-associated plant pathogenesis-related protein 1 [Orchesella cincta]
MGDIILAMTPEKKALLFKIGIGLSARQSRSHQLPAGPSWKSSLTLNLDLCEIAQMCAMYYARSRKLITAANSTRWGKISTSQGRDRENLWITNNGWTDMARQLVVLDEIEDYNFSDVKSNHDKFLKVGHITQELWIGSKELGVGIASATSSTPAYIVYQYYPAGNLWTEDMQYVEKNVKPPLPGVPAIEIYGFWGWLPENVTKNVEAEENNFLQTHREYKELLKEIYG